MNSENGAQEFDPFAHEPEKKEPRKSGGGIAWLALLLALAAAGFTGYQWWLERQAGTEDAQQQSALQSLQRAQAGLEQTVKALEERVAVAESNSAAGEIAVLKSSVDSLQDRLAGVSLQSSDGQARFDAAETAMLSLRQRIASVEDGIAALAVRGDSPGKRMDLAEVEYLLRLASERLQLFGDPRSAGQALSLADSRLESLDDPLYVPVRQRIARARQALRAIPAPDTLDLTNRIAVLQSGIAALPFSGEVHTASGVADDPDDISLWARFKRTMAGLVTVRRRVPEADVMLNLEDKDYVRQGLWLQLESARLAVMRSDTVAWQSSLQRAAETLEARFETGSTAVTGAIAEIRSLTGIPVAAEMPDISAPWAQLRLLREGREGMESEPAEAQTETAIDAGEPPVQPAEETGEGAGAG